MGDIWVSVLWTAALWMEHSQPESDIPDGSSPRQRLPRRQRDGVTPDDGLGECELKSHKRSSMKHSRTRCEVEGQPQQWLLTAGTETQREHGAEVNTAPFTRPFVLKSCPRWNQQLNNRQHCKIFPLCFLKCQKDVWGGRKMHKKQIKHNKRELCNF